MQSINSEQVRATVLKHLASKLAGSGLKPEDIDDGFDLLARGTIDSFGIIEMISAVEQDLGVQVDFARMSSDELTIVGPFCRFVAQNCQGGAAQG
jgi:acyl carrier protein